MLFHRQNTIDHLIVRYAVACAINSQYISFQSVTKV